MLAAASLRRPLLLVPYVGMMHPSSCLRYALILTCLRLSTAVHSASGPHSLTLTAVLLLLHTEHHGEAYRQGPMPEHAPDNAMPSPAGETSVQRAASQEADDDVAGLSPAGSIGADDDDEALALKAAADKPPSPKRLLTVSA